MVDQMDESGNVTKVEELAVRVRESVQRVIVGKDRSIDLSVVALLCRGHILVEDVPGIGKTTLSKALAQSLECTFKRIQFTLDLMPNDVVGVNFFNQRTSEFEVRPGPIFSQVLLAEEINRATPRTQSALLEAMQEVQATIDGITMALPRPFLVMATQNPIEMEGTFPLPEAQLDRFMVRVTLGYPTPEEESEIFVRFEQDFNLPDLDPVTSEDELQAAQKIVLSARVDQPVREYIVDIVGRTRDHSGISLGASPRAGLALYKTTQAWAAIEGRDFVIPDDVKLLAPPVLPHRMIVVNQQKWDGSGPERITAMESRR